MKSNCIGLADLLCAYADGELADKNIKLVEDHLAICENCSAILKVYKEITMSVNDTNEPAPDALRIGVMNRIQSESTPRKTDTDKLRKNYRMILARFVPVAACLVVMLLVWQFWGDLFGVQQDHASPAATSAPDLAVVAAPEFAINVDDADYGVQTEPAPASGGTESAGFENESHSIADDPGRRMSPEEAWTTDETEQFMEYISKAYAEITITGELPVLLSGIEPLPLGPWFGWELIFEIPAAEVPTLLEELSGRNDVTTVNNTSNNESTYAVIFYSP